MDETALIRRHFADIGPPAGATDVALGIGDDCALLRVPADRELALCTDTLVAGRHFPLQTAPADVGWKALAVNLSDLAAMGAQPRWFTLALTLPGADPDWLRDFARGLATLARREKVTLVGGDTTRGPLTVTVTAGGWVDAGRALRRAGARAGDLVCVTGTLGDAALALRLPGTASGNSSAEPLRRRLNRPEPRIAAGRALGDLADAAIDLSDGLALDLSRITEASGVGAELDATALPRSPAFGAWAPPGEAALELQLGGGDDYELCVCLPGEALPDARARLGALDLPLTVVGRIEAEPGLRLRTRAGTRVLEPLGYDHFAEAAP